MGHARPRPCKRFLRHEPPTEGDWAIIEALGRFGFAPLVCEEPRLAASVEIVMLRPEPEGRIFVRSGDIDNRPKTLLDALKMPNEEAALPSSATPTADESPSFCLLEDDGPITKLEPAAHDPDEVVLVLRTRTGATDVVVGNSAIFCSPGEAPHARIL